MLTAPQLLTERLILRRWTDADRAPFAAMNADAEVMRYFPAPLDRAASNAFVDRIEAGFDDLGYGLWARTNERSRAVMRRLGMTRQVADDFEHPRVPEGRPLRPHVLYRLSRDDWTRTSGGRPA